MCGSSIEKSDFFFKVLLFGDQLEADFAQIGVNTDELGGHGLLLLGGEFGISRRVTQKVARILEKFIISFFFI